MIRIRSARPFSAVAATAWAVAAKPGSSASPQGTGQVGANLTEGLLDCPAPTATVRVMVTSALSLIGLRSGILLRLLFRLERGKVPTAGRLRKLISQARKAFGVLPRCLAGGVFQLGRLVAHKLLELGRVLLGQLLQLAHHFAALRNPSATTIAVPVAIHSRAGPCRARTTPLNRASTKSA